MHDSKEAEPLLLLRACHHRPAELDYWRRSKVIGDVRGYPLVVIAASTTLGMNTFGLRFRLGFYRCRFTDETHETQGQIMLANGLGNISRCGNSHQRCVLTECAEHYAF